jgi:hypothetical protein
MPYDSDSQRSIGTAEDAFMPGIDEDGALVSDVGLVVRIVEPGGRPVFVIAGCFGAGTLGAARYSYSPENLVGMPTRDASTGVEAVLRSRLRGWDVSDTELLYVKYW